MIKSYWNDNGSYIDIDHSVTDTISYQGNGYVPSEVYKLTFLKESDNGLINLTGDS